MQIFLWSQFWPSSKNRFQITCLVHARTRDRLSSLVITHLKHMWEKVSFLEGAQCWELLLKEVPVLQRRQWHPTPVLLPGKSHGRRSLVGCSPWGHRVGRDWVTSLSLFTFMHWRRKWQPTPVFLPGESQGWGGLVGCHLWGRTESDTTEAT